MSHLPVESIALPPSETNASEVKTVQIQEVEIELESIMHEFNRNIYSVNPFAAEILMNQ